MAGLLLCQLAGAGTWGAAEAVTIYRLGGEDHASFPLPSEVADGRAGFEQLSWAHVDPAAAGASDNVNLDGALAPFYHGSHENVLDSAQERGGVTRAMATIRTLTWSPMGTSPPSSRGILRRWSTVRLPVPTA